MLFIAFGALVLVPILVGFDPNVALFTAGLGTLLFQVISKGKVPVFLASSFAFIAPIKAGVENYGLPETLSGLAVAGLLYVLLSGFVWWRGPDQILKLLPPIVTGPVIMVIGLSLAPIAIQMASEPGPNYGAGTAQLLAALALSTTIAVALQARGTFQLIPILMGIAVGYGSSLVLRIIDFEPVLTAPWLMVPSFVHPTLHWPAITFFIPVAIAPAIEHIGDILVISSVTGQSFLRDPGLHRTLLGDGVATSIAALLGGPPNTTYSEVTGAVALTKAFNPGIMTWAALFAVFLSFSGKLGALLKTVPPPVMGGVLVVLFGTIVVVGINSLVQSGQNLLQSRNMIIVGVILVLGVGNMSLKIGQFALEGIGLSSLAGILLNGILPNPCPGE